MASHRGSRVRELVTGTSRSLDPSRRLIILRSNLPFLNIIRWMRLLFWPCLALLDPRCWIKSLKIAGGGGSRSSHALAICSLTLSGDSDWGGGHRRSGLTCRACSRIAGNRLMLTRILPRASARVVIDKVSIAHCCTPFLPPCGQLAS